MLEASAFGKLSQIFNSGVNNKIDFLQLNINIKNLDKSKQPIKYENKSDFTVIARSANPQIKEKQWRKSIDKKGDFQKKSNSIDKHLTPLMNSGAS